MSRIPALLPAMALAATLAAQSSVAAQRTFVASFGSDANTAANCSFANPCRGFTAALGVTDSGGEIVALDAAGYGVVNINKSVTITANPGFYAGITAASGDAVTIATAGVKVVLRGLNINGTGAINGIVMSATGGASLSVENCVISAFISSGIAVQALGASVRIVDSVLRANGASSGSGIYADLGSNVVIGGTKVFGSAFGVFTAASTAASTLVAVADSNLSANGNSLFICASIAGGTARASVTRSTIAQNAAGVHLGNCVGTQLVTASRNLVTGNTTGFWNEAGTFETEGDNTLRQNTSNAVGTMTAVTGS